MVMNGEFSVGLSNTITSLFRDDEDYQILHAAQLLTYLSNKGFYPPEEIHKIMIDILKSLKSNDPAVVYNIIKVLNSLKDEQYYIGSGNWELLLSVFISLNVHLKREALVKKNGGGLTFERSNSTGSGSNGINNVFGSSSRGSGGGKNNDEAEFPFLSSKVLVTYFISMYESMNTLTTSAIDHPLYNMFSQTGNRVSIIFEEIMSIIGNCDFDTLKEMIKFVVLVYRIGGPSWEFNIQPLICQNFKHIKTYNRKALFCQLMPYGRVKNKILKGILEGMYTTSDWGGSLQSLSRKKKSTEKELIEELTPWFKRITTIALKKKSKRSKKNSDDDDEGVSDTDDEDDLKPPLFSNSLDIQDPIGEIELFIIMVCQLYQSAIVTSTQAAFARSNLTSSPTLSSSQTSEPSSSQNNNNEPTAIGVDWNTIYQEYKELHKTILTLITDNNNCKNPTLIKNNLSGLDVILNFKAASSPTSTDSSTPPPQ